MSEEIKNAATIVPKSMIWSLALSGVVGLSMFIAILFCTGDVQKALDTDYVYPFIEVLVQAMNSTGGSAAIVAILIVVDLGLMIGVVAASSRMLWSFARDRGLPGWHQISKVPLLFSNCMGTTAKKYLPIRSTAKPRFLQLPS